MTTDTEWRPVVAWEGFHECSNKFEVRGVDRLVTRSDGRKFHVAGQLLRQHEGSVILQRPGQREHRCVHKLVAEAFGEEKEKAA
jgi:hypothetical protein